MFVRQMEQRQSGIGGTEVDTCANMRDVATLCGCLLSFDFSYFTEENSKPRDSKLKKRSSTFTARSAV